MQPKHLLLSLLAASAAHAQHQSLTDVLTSQSGNLSTLISLLEAQPALVGALAGLEGITILAPNNAAFEALLADPAAAARVQNEAGFVPALLSYHVLNGTFYAADFLGAEGTLFAPTLLMDAQYTTVQGGQRVSAMVAEGRGVVVGSGGGEEAVVVGTDFNFTTGTIHIIDSVLSIPGNLTTVLVQENLTALAGAATTANVVDTLVDVPQLTLFAPNNAAFEAIADVAAGLSVEELATILGYHVVAGAVVYSVDVQDGAKVNATAGGELTFKVNADGVFVNDKKVVKPDVLVANGVVHVIDGVLIPESDGGASPSGTPSMAPSGTAAPSATVVPGMAAGLDTKSGVVAALVAGGLAALWAL